MSVLTLENNKSSMKNAKNSEIESQDTNYSILR